MKSAAGAARAGLTALRVDLILALTFLTRLPLRLEVEGPVTPDRLAGSLRVYPLVGAAIGAAAALVLAVALAAGLPSMPAAGLALAAQMAFTGALHEDGLADVADGFGGGRDRAAKLAIMRDSRIGTFGVLALVVSVLLRTGALAAIAAPANEIGGGLDSALLGLAALVAAGALSRAVLPLIMRALKPARNDGLGASHGRPHPGACGLAVGSALAIALLALGPVTEAATGVATALVAAVVAALAAASCAALAHRHIAGYTGDVLGAAQQMAETAALLAIAAIAANP